ncbi:lytic polysaccharide monooxygenase auxiliary activity family 9 protein [Saccharothrix coeruleofusca]|uniref:Chitin-binding protein n=1 Tax=Saccharothrix coeruleofusca TaxID=33919 RepID=A0A918ANG3_9PSEU|nr:lytic polysaccharide monooxygenase [Saccharothrix coeruleofusca]MBP2337870.1 chitin-binding protein [Saccharothrix coeruleofusca]GGP62818.1 chitin-binding protein [Saccharothrix coeruleofusca]
MTVRRWIALATAAVAGIAIAVVANVAAPDPASAHGAMMKPGSRTFLCWRDGLSPQGNIVPKNPGCAAAVNAGGANALYNWFGVLRSDGAGRTRGFIPDGKLCSGGNSTYSGFDIARADYPVTHLTAGANFSWSYNMWAAHPGTFHMYVTKSSYDPNRALSWNDLEDTPFLSVTNPPSRGAVGSVDGQYYWNGNLPSGKSGRHIIYSVWTRSDSQETFYNCSDVVFDGGNGEVTGIGQTGTGDGPTTTVPDSGHDAKCMAIYKITSAWDGGFQGEVEIMNHSTSPYDGWSATWNFASGQTVNSLWNGVLTTSGSQVVVKNVEWNRSIGVEQSTTFGFTASYSGSNSLPTVTCSSP